MHSFRALAFAVKFFYFSDDLFNEVGELGRPLKFTVGVPIFLADGPIHDASILTLVAVGVIIIVIFIKHVLSSVAGGNAPTLLLR